MCVICALEPGQTITSQEFGSCWQSNPDGGGLAYVLDGRIVIEKSMTKDSLYRKYMKANEERGDSPLILHFRIGTSGDSTVHNVHPFEVNDSVAFCHNGVFSEYSHYGTKDSDTRLFNEDILKKLPDGFQHNESILPLLDIFCTGSKLVFLDIDKKLSFVNKNSGVESNGRWFSNGSYKTQHNWELFKKNSVITEPSLDDGVPFGDGFEEDEFATGISQNEMVNYYEQYFGINNLRSNKTHTFKGFHTFSYKSQDVYWNKDGLLYRLNKKKKDCVICPGCGHELSNYDSSRYPVCVDCYEAFLHDADDNLLMKNWNMLSSTMQDILRRAAHNYDAKAEVEGVPFN